MAGLPRSFEMVICIQRRFAVECDQYKRATLPIGQLGKSALPRKEADQDRTKVTIDHIRLSGFARGLLSIFKGLILTLTYIITSCLPVRQKGGTRRVIPRNWLAVYTQRYCFAIPDSKVHRANMGPTWVLSAPDGSHVGPMNLAMRDVLLWLYNRF